MRHAFTATLGVLLALSSAALAEPVTLSLVQTNDIYKMSEEGGRGGFARLAAVVKAERGRGGHVLFVHAGDTLSPSLMSSFDQGEAIMALTNLLRPDVFVPGNHEFDFGKEVYLRRMGEAQFPIYVSNLRGPDGAVLAGHRDGEIVEIGGVKLGIVGVTDENSPSKSSPGDLRFAPALDTVRTEAARLRAAGADLVIAVAHTDRAIDQRMFEARIAEVLLTGDDHDLRVVFDGRGVMVESSEDAKYVVVTDLTIDKQVKDGRTSISWWPNFRVIDTATVTPDPAVAAAVSGYEALLGKELDVAVAQLDAPLDSRTALVRTGEAAIGNLIADAIRASSGAEVAIINGGGIRGNRAYPAGHALTRRDILTELPFGNRVVMVELTGADLLATIENGLAKLPEPSGRFPQVSGIRVTADPARPAGTRVLTIDVGGVPLDPARHYTLAVNDFLLRGGDGYDRLSAGRVLLRPEDGKLVANDVMVHAKALGRISAGIEGRIVLGP